MTLEIDAKVNPGRQIGPEINFVNAKSNPGRRILSIFGLTLKI